MAAKNIWLIGRDSECDIVLSSKNVSRKQAELVCENNVYYLVNHSKHKTSFIQRGEQKIQVQKQKVMDSDLMFFADEGPYSLQQLIDDDQTVIDFNSPLTLTPTAQGGSQNLDDKIEKKRCPACATIIAKAQSKCHECGSFVK